MRTTIDLPDPVFRHAKARAALQGRTLKELLTEYVELGLKLRSDDAAPFSRPRSEPPLFLPQSANATPLPFRTTAELEELLLQEEIERFQTCSM